MTTSGTVTYNPNRDQIIKRAARLINAIDSGATPDDQTISDFNEALNAMVKEWQATGIHVWMEQEATLFLQVGQNAYNIGSSSTDHCTASYVAASLSANVLITATSVSADDVTGMTIGDNIGIVLDNGYFQWTTITNIVGTTISLNAALTDSSTAGNPIYTYTTNLVRPLRVISCRRFTFAGEVSTPMAPMMARYDYRNLPTLQNQGPVNQAFYDPQLVLGVLNVWPTPEDVGSCVNMTVMRQVQDFNVASDTADFPVEWVNCLVYNLALQMAPEFGVPTEQYAIIEKRAMESLDRAMSFDKEPESFFVGVNLTSRAG